MVLGTSAEENPSLLESLKQSAGQQKIPPFRERAEFVGSVYTISYNNAIVAVYDHDREEAGGLPKNGFLMAAKMGEDESFILLRIQSEARLPAAAANDQTRQESIEDSGNQGPWADRLPDWVRDKMSLHGLECSVLGTFIDRGDGTYRYAEDIANYYAVNELMVWKPDAESLDLIVNHQHRTNDIPVARKAAKIGRTRFAAADPDGATKADFRINPTDILKRRTAYFGMSRSGKSNGLKIVAENIYQIRKDNPKHRVGQVIFDLSGEYAQDTYQERQGTTPSSRNHRITQGNRSDHLRSATPAGLGPRTQSDEAQLLRGPIPNAIDDRNSRSSTGTVDGWPGDHQQHHGSRDRPLHHSVP